MGLKNLVSWVRLANDFAEMQQLRVNQTRRVGTPKYRRVASEEGIAMRSGAGGLAFGAKRFALCALAIAGALVMNSCSKPPPDSGPAPGAPTTTNAPVAVTTPVTNTVSENMLSGRWVRPDGGYVIEVRGAHTDGKLEAYYFNPQPINVSHAEWRREHDGLHVFIELRDQNYPGATYKLHYLPDKDQLTGEYFQPVYQQTYEVQFIRQNK